MVGFSPQDEVNLSGYKKFLTSQAAPLPLTAAEEELRQIKLSEVLARTHSPRYDGACNFICAEHTKEAIRTTPLKIQFCQIKYGNPLRAVYCF